VALPTAPKTRFLAHPKGLYVLFFSEMWERFSYYGMRALLVLYLTGPLLYKEEAALEIYGLYTGMVYLTPLLGGFLADRWLGYRGTVLAGALLMMLGHFAMAIPSLLFPALALLILGNGLFKPNISTIVGSLYLTNDPRRDAAFTLFYMGINLGAFLSPLVCGSLSESFSPHWGFGAAGVGMLISLLIFLGGLRTLRPAEGTWMPLSAMEITRVTITTVIGLILSIGAVEIARRFIGRAMLSEIFQWMLLGFILLVLIYLIFRLKDRSERYRTLSIFILGLFTALFWMGFEQAGGTLNLFARDYTDRAIRIGSWNWAFPAEYFQSLNPLLIFILAPLFSLLWIWLASRGREPVIPVKMSWGLLLLGLGFLLMTGAEGQAKQGLLVSPLWLGGVYFLHTLGELCLSPVGLSMVTRTAPASAAALLMGVWFLASAFGNYMAGVSKELFQKHDLPFYPTLALIGIGSSILLWLLARPIHRLMTAR
jgi:POT family proton-dependent oligopeptide transporter